MSAIRLMSEIRLLPAIFLFAAVALACDAGAAVAEIKDYQIARMLNVRTECRLMSLARLDPREGEVERFFGECGNLVSYPDGVEIVCPEADDEWACKVVTEKKEFDSLDLLRQRP